MYVHSHLSCTYMIRERLFYSCCGNTLPYIFVLNTEIFYFKKIRLPDQVITLFKNCSEAIDGISWFDAQIVILSCLSVVDYILWIIGQMPLYDVSLNTRHKAKHHKEVIAMQWHRCSLAYFQKQYLALGQL